MKIGIVGYSPLINQSAARSWSKIIYYLARTLLRRGHEVIISPAFDAVKLHGVYVRIDKYESLVASPRDLGRLGCEIALFVAGSHLFAPYECSRRRRALDAFEKVFSEVKASGVRRIVAYTSLDLYENVPHLTLEYLAKRFDYLIFFNEEDAKIFAKSVEKHPKYSVVTPGVDTSLYSPASKRCEEPTLLYVGRNSIEKDPARLLAVLALLRKHSVAAKLVMLTNVCGLAPYGIFDLAAAAASLGVAGDVIFVEEYIDEEKMPEVYRSARVFITLSGSEGVCLPILEAQACGVPVVAQELPSLKSVYGDSYLSVSREGTYYLPHGSMPLASVANAAAKVKALLEDECMWEEYSKKGLENARRYDWDKAVGPRFEKALEEALSS